MDRQELLVSVTLALGSQVEWGSQQKLVAFLFHLLAAPNLPQLLAVCQYQSQRVPVHTFATAQPLFRRIMDLVNLTLLLLASPFPPDQDMFVPQGYHQVL